MAKLVNCKVCGAEIAKSAPTCPHCGAKRKKRGMGCFGSLFLVFLIFIVIGIASSDTSGGASDSDDIFYNESSGDLENVVSPQDVVGQFGNHSIEGSVKNISGSELAYAQITFALYDAEGAQIGSAVANINNLADGATWKYSAVPLTMDSFSTFELSDISGW